MDILRLLGLVYFHINCFRPWFCTRSSVALEFKVAQRKASGDISKVWPGVQRRIHHQCEELVRFNGKLCNALWCVQEEKGRGPPRNPPFIYFCQAWLQHGLDWWFYTSNFLYLIILVSTCFFGGVDSISPRYATASLEPGRQPPPAQIWWSLFTRCVPHGQGFHQWHRALSKSFGGLAWWGSQCMCYCNAKNCTQWSTRS